MKRACRFINYSPWISPSAVKFNLTGAGNMPVMDWAVLRNMFGGHAGKREDDAR
jgi:hypothetical protein